MKRKIKIVEITTIHPANDTRITRYTNYLKLKNYAVVVYSATSSGSNKFLKNRIKNKFFYLSNRFILLFKTLIYCLKTNADIIHFHDPEITLPGALISRLMNKKAIFDIHELYTSSKFWRIYFKLAYRFLKNKCLFIGAGKDISESIKKSKIPCYTISNLPLSREYKKISNKSSSNSNKVSFRKKSFKIFFSAGYYKKRCIDQFLYALNMINDEVDFHAIICGSGYETFNKEYNDDLNKKISYKKILNYQTCLKLCKNADLSIVLFNKDKNHFFVRSNRFFESINLGTPVITSNFGEWKSFLKKYPVGIGVNPSSSIQISDAILKVYQDKLKSNKYKNYCKKIGGKFNWETQNNHLKDLIESLISK
jgi:glycosyltransferase involved in cell wall biosynthesis